MKTLLITLISAFLFLIAGNIFASNLFSYTDSVYNPQIQTVQCTSTFDTLGYPIIILGKNGKLEVSFDELDATPKEYYYSIVHCNADFTPSNLSFLDYARGFEENTIQNVQASQNTTFPYIHYSLQLPNRDIQITKSGNYFLIVYEQERSQPIFTKLFYVVEPLVNISGVVRQPTDVSVADKMQAVMVTVTPQKVNIRNPAGELNVCIFQNFRQDNGVYNSKLTFTSNNELRYHHETMNLFDAGAEFHAFNSKNHRTPMGRIDEIKFITPHYNFYLLPDYDRAFKPYQYNQELNGRFFIEGYFQEQNDIRADYVMVHFSLPYKVPLINGDIFIFGALSNWRYLSSMKMSYNFETKSYQQSLLLKQGYYNYQYMFKEKKSSKGDISFIEGSHYVTENNYLILVYYQSPAERYEQLIGYQVINSITSR